MWAAAGRRGTSVWPCGLVLLCQPRRAALLPHQTGMDPRSAAADPLRPSLPGLPPSGHPHPPPRGRCSSGPRTRFLLSSFPESLWTECYNDPISAFTLGPAAVAVSFARRRRLCPRASAPSTSARAVYTCDPVLTLPACMPLLPGRGVRVRKRRIHSASLTSRLETLDFLRKMSREF